MIDNSFKETYNDKGFDKLASAHKNSKIISIKHNLYQQSKWSRSIYLNTSHIILFKTARNIKQVEFSGNLLKLVQFLKHCYQLATKEPFGRLLIDSNAKTSDCTIMLKFYWARS